MKQDQIIENRLEHSEFLKNALAWNGAVSKKILPMVALSVAYAWIVLIVLERFPEYQVGFGPFEFSGVFIGLLLVFRINAGYDRWWEARKLWGSVVNQSRNLAISALTYSRAPKTWRREFASHVALFPHVMRLSLRGERDLSDFKRLLGETKSREYTTVDHWPSVSSTQTAKLLQEARDNGWLDNFAFHRAERERSILIDDIGACERILKTPMPFVFAIKLKRFIFIFLLLLPLALVSKLGELALFIDGIVAYTMLSLDRMGFELQNPFSKFNLSHLPLDTICDTIEKNILEIENTSKHSASLEKVVQKQEKKGFSLIQEEIQ